MRIYAYLALAGLLSAGVGMALYFSYSAGKDAVRADLAAQIEEYRDNQRLLVNKLEKANAKERIVTREKIKIVRVAADSTGCASRDIPDSILNQLH